MIWEFLIVLYFKNEVSLFLGWRFINFCKNWIDSGHGQWGLRYSHKGKTSENHINQNTTLVVSLNSCSSIYFFMSQHDPPIPTLGLPLHTNSKCRVLVSNWKPCWNMQDDKPKQFEANAALRNRCNAAVRLYAWNIAFKDQMAECNIKKTMILKMEGGGEIVFR